MVVRQPTVVVVHSLAVQVLLSWIGAQDPWRPREGRTVGKLRQMPMERPPDCVDGPILTFLAHLPVALDAIYLLHDPAIEQTGGPAALSNAIATRYPPLQLNLRHVPIDEPRTYEPIYRHVRAVCEEVRAKHGDDAEYHVLLSPGSPQMHATWVLLVKTVFPATAWQSSDHPGQSRAEIASIPFDIEAELTELTLRVEKRRIAPARQGSLVYASEAMKKVVDTVRLVADSQATVLLLGENGVGKEGVARLLHDLSPRRQQPFVAVNCAALPDTLLEGELFGYCRGAFTGATRDRAGLFVAAQQGTIFLDEIGDMSPSLQVKLLRILQENTVRPLGSDQEVSIGVRVVAATNHDLRALIAEGRFRADLYYRLGVVPIIVPPLRERREDIPILIEHFLKLANGERMACHRPTLQLQRSAWHTLEAYHWPGNVRELQNAIQRLALLAPSNHISIRNIRDIMSFDPVTGFAHPRLDTRLLLGHSLHQSVAQYERLLIEEAFRQHKTQKQAAMALGLHSPQALQKRIKRLNALIDKAGHNAS